MLLLSRSLLQRQFHAFMSKSILFFAHFQFIDYPCTKFVSRLNTPDNNRYELLQWHKSGYLEDGLSCRSSCNSLICMSEGPKSSDDSGFSKCLVYDRGC
jgi:hypothetical protein